MKKSGRSSQAGDIRAPEYEHPSTATRSPLPQRERQRGGASPPQKEANHASLRSAAPSKGRGSRGHILLPMEGGAPKGWRLDGGSGMKKSGKDRHKYAVYESTLSTADAVPLPQWGRLRYESSAIPISSERIHACVEKQYPRQSLPRVGKVASGASRIGY